MPGKPKKRPDGLIEKTVTDPRTKKRLHFYGHTEAEVNRKLLEFAGQLEQGRLFSAVAGEWQDIHWPELAPNTLRSYRPAFRRAVDEFGNQSIKSIRPQDIKRFLAEFARGDRAKKTVTTQLGILSMIFSFAVESGDIDVSPCDHVSIPKGLKKTHREAATPEDEAIVKQSHHIWLLPYLILYTGLRRGEALALTYADIDRTNRVIHVTKSVYDDGRIPRLKRPKTEAGIREVPILDPLAAVLPTRGKGYLFSMDGGKTPLNNAQYQKLWDNYVKETGIRCCAHQLRHSYATMLFECGVELKDAQDLLGHSTAAMTQDIYTHLRNSRRQATAKMLNEKIKSWEAG